MGRALCSHFAATAPVNTSEPNLAESRLDHDDGDGRWTSVATWGGLKQPHEHMGRLAGPVGAYLASLPKLVRGARGFLSVTLGSAAIFACN